MFSKQLNYWG